MINNIEKAQKILIKYKQEQIINHMNKLKNEEQEKLAQQVLNINFEELKLLYENTKEAVYTDLAELLPVNAVNPSKLNSKELKEIINCGEDIVRNNKFALVTMAGGQGTRLRT